MTLNIAVICLNCGRKEIKGIFNVALKRVGGREE
jgi:hypothetical protein